MKLTNAIRRLEKAGYRITNDGILYAAKRPNNRRAILFSRDDYATNEPDIHAIFVSQAWFPNLRRAISYSMELEENQIARTGTSGWL
jgi:hypothetical protein